MTHSGAMDFRNKGVSDQWSSGLGINSCMTIAMSHSLSGY